MSISVRELGIDDRTFLLTLYRSTREDEVRSWGWNESQVTAFMEMQFEVQTRSFRGAYPEAENSIVLDNGEPIGRMIVARSEREITLVDIAILPQNRGAGTGTFLIKRLLEESQEKAIPVRLQVLKGNRAEHLYERLGLAKVEDDAMYQRMEYIPKKLG